MSTVNHRTTIRRIPLRRAWALVLLLLVVQVSPALAEVQPEILTLRAGESRVIPATDVARVAVGQPSIADVRVLSPGEILINGKGEGQTTLLLWPSSGRVTERVVRVLGPSPVLTAQDVVDLLADGGVRVKEVAGYLVVDGRATPEGQVRLARLTGLLGSRLLDLTESPSPESRPETLPAAKREDDLGAVTPLLRRIGGTDIATEWRAGKMVLSGRVAKEATRREVIALAGTFFPGQVVDALAVTETTPLFTIKARVIEVDRQANRELGVEWPDTVSVGEASPPASVAIQPISRLEPLLVKLKTLEQEGRARILAQPSMVVADGSEGLFLAGGQIPVPLEVDGQTTVEWKEYGVRLKVQPTVLPSGRVRLLARPEVSTLDWANGVKLSGGTVPALRTRFADTAVEQASGDTLILAGLSLAEESDHTGRLPGISDIPLLRGLFKSTRGARRQTELTILLTTTLITAGDQPSGDQGGGPPHGGG